ncbi:MAG TPA: septum formation initiator family protein [Gemmatimonadaceae bacterium]|nr:septum formation initiator family protein [Gemmatimonadaceae bacterium]
MKKKIGRLVLVLVALAAVAFAVEGGEYGTWDLVQQGVRKQQIQVAIDSLRREIDSLEAVRRSIIADPKVQERIAREEFGMVRGDKEILYRFAEPAPDTAR